MGFSEHVAEFLKDTLDNIEGIISGGDIATDDARMLIYLKKIIESSQGAGRVMHYSTGGLKRKKPKKKVSKKKVSKKKRTKRRRR
tara:strand:- start:40 stop:294 length:255 start_codon:yes stop_codon:yes gene_type:complete